MTLAKCLALVLGAATAGAGFVLFWTPIPVGVVLVPLGFYILGSQFAWAADALEWIKSRTGPFGRAVRRAEGRSAARFARWRAALRRLKRARRARP